MTVHNKDSAPMHEVRYDVSLLSDDDVHLFNEGTHYKLYDKLGAHSLTANSVSGVYFAVWAPNAGEVHIIGDFNGWDHTAHALRPRGVTGIWEGFITGLSNGTVYKYYIVSSHNNYAVEKADPYAFHSEVPPKTASVVFDLDFNW